VHPQKGQSPRAALGRGRWPYAAVLAAAALVLMALQEPLRVPGARGSSKARQNRQGEKSRNDRLHDQSPYCLRIEPLWLVVHVSGSATGKRVARVRVRNSDGRQRSREVSGARLDRKPSRSGSASADQKTIGPRCSAECRRWRIATVHKAPAPRWRPGATCCAGH